MAYELWNLSTGNAIAGCETEAEALAIVREEVAVHDRSVATAWALADVDDDGEMESIAEGDALIDRALDAETAA